MLYVSRSHWCWNLESSEPLSDSKLWVPRLELSTNMPAIHITLRWALTPRCCAKKIWVIELRVALWFGSRIGLDYELLHQSSTFRSFGIFLKIWLSAHSRRAARCIQPNFWGKPTTLLLCHSFKLMLQALSKANPKFVSKYFTGEFAV
jgi:hypothetical protein